MTRIQSRTLITLSIAACILFALFFWPNSQNALDEQMLAVRSMDEPIIYPYVLKMLSPSQSIHEAWGKLIIYGDYHYGYPFYFLSCLVLLPVKMIFGDAFNTQTPLNLMLLRQFVSVLPMLVSILLMVYLQTRYQSLIKSAMMFGFLFCISGVVRNNLNWWHPDALTVLFLVLTYFFLDKDRYKFGKFFYLAAICSGIATAIKLQGVFFGLTILFYLIIGGTQKKITFKKGLMAAVGFILVFLFAYIISNPFMFYDAPRQRYIDILTGKSGELSSGYTHDNPAYYQTGPVWWYSTLVRWYGHPFFWAFTFISLVLGCWKGQNTGLNRHILLYFIPFSIYLLYFVAPKPDHYWLPVVFPFFSAIMNIPYILEEIIPKGSNRAGRRFEWIFNPYIIKASIGLIYGLIIYEWVLYISQDIPLFLSYIDKV